MCGITGIAQFDNSVNAEAIISKMNDAQHHRGPDDAGVYIDHLVALGHTRLSIIDLSSAGHQPMFSSDRQCVIVFNGEIYNFRELKQRLKSYPYSTDTDTEVIVAAYREWGSSFAEHLDGMFAIALYDIAAGKLLLCRDRLGVKPIYYTIASEGTFLFASEIRTLLKSGLIQPRINDDVLADYLTFQTTPGHNTLIREIRMLDPGTVMEFHHGRILQKKYWQPSANIIDKGLPYAEVKKHVREMFLSAVSKRMISDVPLGAFLSGGIDSSAVVAAMKACSEQVNTFNVNFSEAAFSEAQYATLIAEKYKTTHTRIDLTPDDFLSMVPAALSALDYPSTDGANTYVVSSAVKKAGLSVALSGIGGDEWFGGYPVFGLLNNRSFDKYAAIPAGMRRIMARSVRHFTKNATRDKQIELLAGPINTEKAYYAIRKMFSEKQIGSILTQFSHFNNRFYPEQNHYSDISLSEWQNYLMPVLLRDTDQMGMAHALEIREPFLDYQLVEYVLSLPDHYKNHKGTKQLFVDAMGDLLPSEIVDRPKMGFVLPWEKWLKGEMRSLVHAGIDTLCNHKAFNEQTLTTLENDYFAGRNHIRWNMIWSLAVLGNWMKQHDIS